VTEFEQRALARIKAWYAKADDLLRCSKAYNCRSNEAIKTGYIKQAAQARMCAEELERDYAETASTQAGHTRDRADQGQAPSAAGYLGEEQLGWKTPDWPIATGEERQDQGT
jgi:hypothetical protein